MLIAANTDKQFSRYNAIAPNTRVSPYITLPPNITIF
jgi:hypothetical protein